MRERASSLGSLGTTAQNFNLGWCLIPLFQMEVLEWNMNGFADSKLQQLKSYYCFQPRIAVITLLETKTNLENLDQIAKITAVFPTNKWTYLYTNQGQGMLTLVRRPTNQNLEIKLVDKSTSFKSGNTDRYELCHVIRFIKNGNLAYSIASIYNPPCNDRFSQNISNLLAHQNLIIGDANKTAKNYPIRNEHYKQIVTSYSLEELVTRATFIPHRADKFDKRATTTPDFCLTTSQFGENLTILKNATLSSDHLALHAKTSFEFDPPSTGPPERVKFIDYKCLENMNTEGRVSRIADLFWYIQDQWEHGMCDDEDWDEEGEKGYFGVL